MMHPKIFWIIVEERLLRKIRHTMIWSDSKPNVSCFKNDFKIYCSLLCNCTSKKAIIVSKYDVV